MPVYMDNLKEIVGTVIDYGKATILASATSATVTFAAIQATDTVVATVNNVDATGLYVRAIPAAGKVSFLANTGVSADTKIGYIVLRV